MAGWKPKPDKQVMDYLEGGSAGNPVSSGGSRRLPKPLQDVVPCPDEAGNVETPPPGPEVGFGMKDCMAAFGKWRQKKEKRWGTDGLHVTEAYKMASEFGPLPKTQREIQGLLNAIPEEAVDYAGVFVSYCVNELYPYKEIELRVSRPFAHLGTCNRGKRWKIVGDVGEDSGCSMEGGEMLIEGNAGNYTGMRMKGGKIVVNGNAGMAVGLLMEGGEVHLNGESYGPINSVRGGDIYHKGKRIYENGRPVSRVS